MSLTVLVTGATGFVGRRLVPALVEAGHQVKAMTRHPDTYEGQGDPVFGDVNDPGSLAAPLEGVDVVIDCTGVFKTEAALAPYFAAGVKKVVVRLGRRN